MPSEVRLPLTSLPPNADRLAALKALFPEAFTEGKIDFDRLKQALGEWVQTDRERYGLSWAGKSDALHVLQSLSVGTLKPDRAASVNFDTTENLIIEGDNLEVLKLLQKSYFGKVKMIYIDPPYNTGNEFIYPDNYREGLDDYLRYSGQLSAEGTATTSNKETDGRYHSKWLSMMYPRLFLAKNLLRDDGVIFVSIDDNEVHNLRLLMNEIFGEENFIASIVWEKSYAPRNSAPQFSTSHEFILVYAKVSEVAEISRLRASEDQIARYQNRDNDPRGVWKAGDITVSLVSGQRGRTYQQTGKGANQYDVVTPSGRVVSPPPGRCWVYSESKFQQLVADNRIWWGTDGGNTPALKRFLSEIEGGQVPQTIWGYGLAGHTQEATKDLKDLFLDAADATFPTPKPVRLIRLMLDIVTDASSDDIVLDFFAGSGTTAQALLESNKEDGGNRKFILVQLAEKTSNKQFPNIADITRERVRRVIQKMNDADAGKLPLEGDAAPDRGFKAFRLAAGNFKIWEGAEGEDADAIAAQLELFADNLLPDATPENILFEILLKAGYDLNAPREEICIAGQPVYSIAGGRHLICLERQGITRETIDAMIERKPVGVICLDEAFHGDDALLTNTLLQMQDAEIIFQTI